MDTMLDTIKTKPIKIEILDISPKNKAVLEFFFNNSGKSLFKKSNQDNADAFIIDYDFPGAKENWQKNYAAQQKPCIIFSFKKVDLPNTVSVIKPIKAKALADAGAKLRKMMALNDVKAEQSWETVSKQEQSATEKKRQLHAEPAIAGNDNAIEADTGLLAIEEEVPLTETEKTSFSQINAKPVQDENVSFNPVDLDTSGDENPGNTAAKTGDEETSIESLLDELSVNIPDTDDFFNDTPEENETGLTSSNPAIPVVNNPVLTPDTSDPSKDKSDKSASTTPNIMLEENDGEMISSDDEIEALLQSIQQRTDEKEQQLESIEQKAANAKPVKPVRELTKAEKRWALLCGDIDDIADADDIKNMQSGSVNSLLRTKFRNISYDTKNHMFSYFLLAIKQAKHHLQVIEMRYLNRTMVIDHALNCVYCDRTIYSESFAKFCSEPSNQADLTMRIIKDEDEIRQYRKIIGLALDTTYSMESFIWTASLLTSRGRLPQQLEITDKIKLKHWPDLPRLEQIPHAVRIAAVFYKHPGNLLEVANWLHIPQRYVFAFYNGVLALDMIEVQKAEISKTPEPSFFEIEESTEKTKNRGLFSRLLTKLGAS